MVAVTVILSVTAVPWSAVGRPVGRVSVGGTDSRAAGACRESSWALLVSLAASVGSSGRALVVHYLSQNTQTHTRNLAARLALTLQGARTSRVGGRWICGNVSDADAGDTTRGRARWVWAYCCNAVNPLCCGARSWRQSVHTRGTHAGTGGSFGGRASARSDGVVSWSVGRPRMQCVYVRGRPWTSGIDDEIDETGATG